ncbi:MAG: hypothetical protein NC344_01215 [Bacteroidales bacterium]|nr:hypothetical protein [Bacteroidales bacterium]MCM1146456.1 hypothetical protein [Bacteroidales bacterium]MCM1205106.1 hypothetical protein [Bacillota bacterium]MCM1509352.1 hypothetical protein [Clostridium sp.]
MMIPYILERLATVNHLLTQCAGKETVSFEEADALASFYRDFNDTTTLITEANRLVNSDIDGLSAFAVSLSSEVETYLSADKSKFTTVDFEAVFDSHIKPYEERYNTAKDISTALWREYSAMSNRLDYLPGDSDDYKTLDIECSSKKTEYDTAHAKTESQYAQWQQEETRCFHIRHFKMLFMDVLMERLGTIARNIVSDTSRIKEEQA